MGSPFSFRRKRPFIYLKNSGFIEIIPSSEGEIFFKQKMMRRMIRDAIEWNPFKFKYAIVVKKGSEIQKTKKLSVNPVLNSMARKKCVFTFCFYGFLYSGKLN